MLTFLFFLIACVVVGWVLVDFLLLIVGIIVCGLLGFFMLSGGFAFLLALSHSLGQ